MTERAQLNKKIFDQAENLSLTGANLAALESFKATGLPHKKLENYKYTNVDEFFPEDLSIDVAKPSFEGRPENSVWMVFKNGFLDEGSINLPESVSLSVKAEFDYPTGDFDALENLNLALEKETIYLDVKANSSVNFPIHITHLSTDGSEKKIVTSRLQVNVGQNSVVKIIEQFNSDEEIKFNRNHLTVLKVAENANVEHVKVVTEGSSSFHFGSVKAQVEKSACFHSFSFTTGAKLSRNNINVELVGVAARGEVHGLYALRGDQHCDNFSHIHHRVERTESSQLFKAVLDDVSHGIFTGKIVVHRDAQLVDSNQLNKNLLLSKKAHADTRPQLEVYADDVKCAHGATVGQLNEDELFYLESRAISPKDAQVMLCHGFVQEALDKIQSEEIRTYLEKLLYEEYEKTIHERIREEA